MTSTSGAIHHRGAQRLPTYATSWARWLVPVPGFNVNVYGVIPAPLLATMFDFVYQPGKMPASFADYLRGLIQERWIIRPKSP